MKSFKIFSLGLIAFFMCALPVHHVNASNVCGDVNNNGRVDISDISRLCTYLSGSITASGINAKNSDVDRNTVIDMGDVEVLREYLAHSVSSLPYSSAYSGTTFPNCTNYSFPDDYSRSYIKYDCSTGSTTTYTLGQSSLFSLTSGNIDDRTEDVSESGKSIVKLNFKESDNNYCRGTGFIVGNHVIATCAHCLYSSGFNTNYSIKIYNDDGETLLQTLNAKELHIPVSYPTARSLRYDYGLIYVENDLSSYGKVSLGTATDYFTCSGSNISISGYPAEVSENSVGDKRYYSSGAVKSSSTSFRLDTYAYASGGNSGGPMYTQYTLNGETFRCAIGICTNTDQDDNAIQFSKGVRITTPILRFFKDNNNIGNNNVG